MGNPLYLAMTAAEFTLCSKLPEKIAWMACHFSPYGFGLSNIPKELPPGSILIINDRIEPTCHDADLVALQTCETAEALQCCGVLLDFQRPDNDLTWRIVTAISAKLPCPVAVSHHYAKDQNCAVFLPPPPIRCDPLGYFAPWEKRDIWLETYEQWETVTVATDLVSVSEAAPPNAPTLPLYDEALRCHYRIDVRKDSADFTLHRGIDELQTFPCSVSKYIALWQEYGS